MNLRRIKNFKLHCQKKTVFGSFQSSSTAVHNIDASKEIGMGVMIFLLNTPPTSDLSSRSSIEPIMFLSRLLTLTETRCWPTELEMAELIWVIRKTRSHRGSHSSMHGS